MKPLPLYLLETLLCSGLFVAVYRLLLVGHLPFVACRRLLLAATVISVLLPALRIPFYPAPPAVDAVWVAPTKIPEREEFVPEAQVVVATDTATASRVDWSLWINRLIGMIYGAGAILLLVLFFRRWMAVRRMRRQCVLMRLPDYTLAVGTVVHTPFSFLRTVFLSPGFQGPEREQILCHEASHIRHHHTVERLVMEAVRCLCWYNPFVWMIGSDLREVQEWEADRDVLDKGYDLTQYRTLIFRQLFGYGPDLICGLNHSFTKKRFLMMTHAGGGKYAFVRLCALVPVVAAMLALCSFTTKSPDGGDDVQKLGQPSGEQEREAVPPADRSPMLFNIPGGNLEVEAVRVSTLENGDRVFTGEVQVAFTDHHELAGTSLCCDSMVLGNRNLEAACFGNVAYTSKEGDLFRAESLRLSVGSDGKIGWRAVSVSASQPLVSVTEIRISDHGILLNDQPVSLTALAGRLRTQGVETTVLSANPDTPMRSVSEVKQVLRELNLLKVRYKAPDMPGVSRILPPPVTDGQPSVVQVIPDASAFKVYPDGSVAIKERNLLLVFVGDKGEITIGMRGKKLNDLAALKRTVERFIRNADDDPELPEKELRSIALPGGGTWSYPASLGVVGLRTSQATGFGTYVAVLDALTEAFGTIRDEAAVAQFGRGYDALGKAEREAVNRAVPICISEAEPVK